ncbi:hypothetical protein DL770_008962 [Monosporascus sp. CRB-9-2]|nr:hypothetical protein DL770_008962 [Monosporascus sp. CRB-9-2]
MGFSASCIAGEDTHEPVFTYLRTIDFRQTIEWKKISASEPDAYMRDLLRSTEAQHDKLWEDLPGMPGWKFDISIAFHHAYADGQSAVIFHRDLLRALNRGGAPTRGTARSRAAPDETAKTAARRGGARPLQHLMALPPEADLGRDHLEEARAVMTQTRSVARYHRARFPLGRLPRDDVAGLTTWVSDWRRRWVGWFGGRREAAWECSNAGSLEARDTGDGYTTEEGGWRIERSVFSQGATPIGAVFALNIAGAEGRGFWMTVSWQETAVEAELMEGLVGEPQGWVDSFGGTGRFRVF